MSVLFAKPETRLAASNNFKCSSIINTR